ncbi:MULTISPECIES: alpha/beta fold hydrolase [Thermomonosporaceae]|uniref:alpha/beta fold hydrolase n=1 Tax=Thermomonosporaceae TaxID=2012 RepID=UPI00255AB130|nr:MULTISPECIES: alpha/beta hydrolase [Thermomonosporaceae]MDL4774017.1 alpha/beta hydrolase [Actinomadura xylanilytica]
MKTATLPVPGADLYYELRGDGPLLLISQSGEGDARRSSDLVDNLVDRFTVLTYDRRGLSRSTRTDPALPVSPETNADDLHHLLAAVTDEPALMLGCSLGALYGLHLAAAHPGQISTLVAHDPATPGLLPSAERDRVARTLEEISAVHRRDGWQAAMRRIAAFTGIDMATMKTEPEVTLPPITPERVTNIEFFLSNDLDGLAHSTLDAGDVARTAGTRVIPSAGRDSANAWNHRCAEELARLLDVPITHFPGGHNGNTTFPRAFAARLKEVLA